MPSTVCARIVDELTTGAKGPMDFNRRDFDELNDEDRPVIIERLLKLIEEGWWGATQLEWMLGKDYLPTLERRLAGLPWRAHGLVFLPYFIYVKTGQKAFIKRMMHALIEAEPAWDRRRDVIGAYLVNAMAKDPLFWDFCRYVILNVPERAMKNAAMIGLAQDKGILIKGRGLSDELLMCVNRLAAYRDAPAAVAVLDKLHKDTGRFTYP